MTEEAKGVGPEAGNDAEGAGESEGPAGSGGVTPREIVLGPWEAWIAPVYFGLYLAYLFWHQENELHHWMSMVLLPLGLVVVLNWGRAQPLRSALASFGLRWGNLTRGLGFTLALGVAVGLLQTSMSRNAPATLEAIMSGRAVWLLPLAFVLMLATAATTEEVFFRGFLQTRLEALTRSKLWGLVLTTFIFGVYHLPYAYFNPRWPSYGDWGAAWGAALGNGVLGGLVLGGLYIYTRKNLVVCIILHALINSFGAMGMIKFGGG